MRIPPLPRILVSGRNVARRTYSFSEIRSSSLQYSHCRLQYSEYCRQSAVSIAISYSCSTLMISATTPISPGSCSFFCHHLPDTVAVAIVAFCNIFQGFQPGRLSVISGLARFSVFPAFHAALSVTVQVPVHSRNLCITLCYFFLNCPGSSSCFFRIQILFFCLGCNFQQSSGNNCFSCLNLFSCRIECCIFAVVDARLPSSSMISFCTARSHLYIQRSKTAYQSASAWPVHQSHVPFPAFPEHSAFLFPVLFFFAVLDSTSVWITPARCP